MIYVILALFAGGMFILLDAAWVNYRDNRRRRRRPRTQLTREQLRNILK